MNFYSFGQDSTTNWDVNKIVYNIRKRINSLNFEYNGNKTKKFDNNLSFNIYKLKTLLDESYSNFLNVSPIDSVYRQSLLVNYMSLKDGNISLQTTEILLDDFFAKATSFDLGLNQNGAVEIPVTVITYDLSLKKVSGFYVYWNFWLDKDNPKPYSKFHAFTNPSSSGFLVPGVYDIWVQAANSSERFPSASDRTRNVIFLKGSEKNISITIQLK